MDRRSFIAAAAALPLVSAWPRLVAGPGAHVRARRRRVAHVRGHHAPRDRQRRPRHARVDSGPVGQHGMAGVAGQQLDRQHGVHGARHRRRVRRAHGARDVGRQRGQAGDRGREPHSHARPRRRLDEEVGAGGLARRARARACKPTALIPIDGIVKDTALRAVARQDRRRRQGARAVRMGGDQHLSRPRRARLRRRRHQGHARIEEHGRQVRGPECAVRRPVPRGRHPRARRLRHPRRQVGVSATRSSAPAARTSRRRSTAARRSSSRTTAGSRWIRPTSRR